MTKYDVNFNDWNIEYIKQIEEIYSYILKSIQYQKQELLDNIFGLDALLSQLALDQDIYPRQDVLSASANISFNI